MNSTSSRQARRARRVAGSSLPQRQRGAAAIFGVLAIIAATVAMLLGINIGTLYYAQRDLQKLATLGALAGVQAGGGCTNNGSPATTGAVTTRVLNALTTNMPSGSSANGLLATIGGMPGVQLGKVVRSGKPGATTNDGLYHFVALADGNSQINAVVVNLSKPKPTLFGAAFFPGAPSGLLYASATASQQPLGGFAVGSTLASLNTTSSTILNPLLSALLGTSVNLNAIDYTNMASTQISLANLMVAAGVNDLNSLLALNTNVAGLQQILVAATSTVNPSVAQLIQGLTLGNAQANTGVSLADLLGNIGNGLNPTVTDAASLVPSLDLVDLLTQLGETAAAKNSPNFLKLQGTPSIPGLLNTFVFLQVQESMQPGFGPVGATAQTAQIRLQVRANVDTAGLNAIFNLLKTLTLGITAFNVQPINLGLDVTVASAKGTLDSIVCPTDAVASPSATVGVQAHVATVQVGTFVGAAQTNPGLKQQNGSLLSLTTNSSLLGLTLLSLDVGIKDLPPPLQVGNTNGAEAGPFSIYGSPTQPAPQTQPHVYNYAACNSLGVALNPLSCGATTDPNNPDQPIPSVSLLTGLSTYVGNLVAKNNLSVVIKLLNIPIDVSAIVDPLVADLNTLLIAPLTNLLSALLDPLLAALGIQLGSGTVLMTNIVTGPPVVVSTFLPGSPNF